MSIPPYTPAYIYDEARLLKDVRLVRQTADDAFCKVLYSPKACSVFEVLELVAGEVHGFAVSSPFEARLAREVARPGQEIHIITPGLRTEDGPVIGDLCDYVILNSFGQWERFSHFVKGKAKCGLRVNPKLSLIGDERYDPCRRYSKLGVPLDQMVNAWKQSPALFEGISGIHFHSNCDAADFAPLLATVRHLDNHLEPLLARMKWINLGGGYLFDEAENLGDFKETVKLLRAKYGVEVFIEPGAAVVRRSGTIVSRVLDIFESDDKMVAVLDTTVNHMAEVYEFQFEPDVRGHTDGGAFPYILAGCTCLAGDVFGEYSFDTPLEVGSYVTFTNVGAYTLVKAHMFNGVNLPSIYARNENGDLILRTQFSYEDYAKQCGAKVREDS